MVRFASTADRDTGAENAGAKRGVSMESRKAGALHVSERMLSRFLSKCC